MERDTDKQRESSTVETTLLFTYRKMLFSIFAAALVTIVLIFVVFIKSIFAIGDEAIAVSTMFVVVIAGAAGALFSSLIRIYNYEDLPTAVMSGDLRGLKGFYVVIYSIVPILVGMIAAGVFYLLLASGLIRGDLFPTFACKAGRACNEFAEFANNWSPDTATDHAKAVVWGFIAGFSERLVPDTLGSFAKSARPAGDRKPKSD